MLGERTFSFSGTTTTEIEELGKQFLPASRNLNFTQSCQKCIHHLRKSRVIELPETGFIKSEHAYYLGKPCFELKTIPTKNSTFQDDLNLLAAKRSKGEVRAAHDLSPLYEALLGVEWDKIRGKGVALHQQIGGLSLQQEVAQPETARKLAKKGSQFFKSTFGKRGRGRRDDTPGLVEANPQDGSNNSYIIRL